MSRCVIQMPRWLMLTQPKLLKGNFSRSYPSGHSKKILINKWYFVDALSFFLKISYITLYRNMTIYKWIMKSAALFTRKKVWFRRTKCPGVPILKYVVSFSERTRHGEPPFHIVLITNIQEKISHYSRDVTFENKII